MLILSRKVGETIEIGDDVKVIVTGIRGNQVQLGIKAPDIVPILRGELEKGSYPRREADRQCTSTDA